MHFASLAKLLKLNTWLPAHLSAVYFLDVLGKSIAAQLPSLKLCSICWSDQMNSE
jgi:hypothetical protein